MKKNVPLFFILFFLVNAALAQQNIVPNGSFENWDSSTCFSPANSIQISNPPLFYANYDSFNCQRVSDSYHGSYAVKLTTVVVSAGDTAIGFFVNGNANSNPASWTGGIPINAIPTGVTGYYKSNITTGDSGVIVFDFRSGKVSAGVYNYKFGGIHSAYTPFSFTFNPPISVTPDSVVFAASSSDFIDNKMEAGSMLQLDSISFTGLVSQPAQFNGDFELWDSTILSKPAGWYDQSNNQFADISKTNDAQSGAYAIELKTTAGIRNNIKQAIPAVLSTGFYNCPNGAGQCTLEGGSPFTGTVDTLAFYYKYLPSGDDSAQAILSFKKNGLVVGGTSPVILFQSNNYTYQEIPFILGQSPDTAIITFQSSAPGDSLLPFVGSDLKIDDLHFKTKAVAPSGVKNISAEKMPDIYPNPTSNGTFIVNGLQPGEQLRVLNILGEQVDISVSNKTGSTATVQMPANASGMYFVQAFSTMGIISTSKVMLSRN